VLKAFDIFTGPAKIHCRSFKTMVSLQCRVQDARPAGINLKYFADCVEYTNHGQNQITYTKLSRQSSSQPALADVEQGPLESIRRIHLRR
jgi:hypothetical protein